jgi:cytochrome c oxidase cbb3-type subunit 3
MVEPEGKQVFADNCAVCHGADAKGNREFGAPNLTDAIWL